jgi:hypothetical protein
MSCAATVGRFLPLDSVHELYRHNPYPRYRSCLAALRRCSSWSMLIIRRKEGHAADPSCHRRLFAHAHQPAICRFMSVEIKKHPANGLSSCPFGFCCACFMPWARPIDIFQATQASCPASRRCGGGKRADYCNSLSTYCYYSPCVPVARVPVQVAWCRCCCLQSSCGAVYRHRSPCLQYQLLFSACKKPVSQDIHRILAAYSTARTHAGVR